MRILERDWPANVMSPLGIWSAIPLCGCGIPEAAVDVIHWILVAAVPDVDGYWALGALEREHPGMAYVCMYALDHCELTEHGTTVRGSWLTEKGSQVLNFLNVFGTNPDRWPDGLTLGQSNYYTVEDWQLDRLRIYGDCGYPAAP